MICSGDMVVQWSMAHFPYWAKRLRFGARRWKNQSPYHSFRWSIGAGMLWTQTVIGSHPQQPSDKRTTDNLESGRLLLVKALLLYYLAKVECLRLSLSPSLSLPSEGQKWRYFEFPLHQRNFSEKFPKESELFQNPNSSPSPPNQERPVPGDKRPSALLGTVHKHFMTAVVQNSLSLPCLVIGKSKYKHAGGFISGLSHTETCDHRGAVSKGGWYFGLVVGVPLHRNRNIVSEVGGHVPQCWQWTSGQGISCGRVLRLKDWWPRRFCWRFKLGTSVQNAI